MAIFMLFFASCDLGWNERAEKLCDEAEASFDNGNIDEAEKLFGDALQTNPYLPQANFGIAKIYEIYRGRFSEAAQYYRRCIETCEEKNLMYKLAARKEYALSNIVNGKMENPDYAFDDIVWAIKRNDLRLFTIRCCGGFLIRQQQEKRRIPVLMSGLRAIVENAKIKVVERLIDKDISMLKIKFINKDGTAKTAQFYFAVSEDNYWQLSGFILEKATKNA
jgi:tetratricopeptide (TPR) repeat protein